MFYIGGDYAALSNRLPRSRKILENTGCTFEVGIDLVGTYMSLLPGYLRHIWR